MSSPSSNPNPNITNNVSNSPDKDVVKRRLESVGRTTGVLKAFLESDNYCFSVFSSRGHGELVQKNT
jgi:hypothetical protein